MQTNKNYVELKIFDFGIEHEEISQMLDLTPTYTWRKGEEYVRGNPKNGIVKVRENNYWEYRVETITNDWIGDQIESFISDILVPRSDAIRNLSDQCHAEFSVVQYMYDGCNPGLYFDKKAMKTLTDCGLEINIDLYVLYQEEEQPE